MTPALNPFRWVLMAFRSAVRTEVERAMDDRRRAFSAAHVAISDEEAARVATFLGRHGVTVRGAAAVLPFPANDHPTRPPAA